MNSFVVVKYLSLLLLPPASLALGTIIGVVLLALGWRRLGLVAILTAAFVNSVMAWPPLGDALLRYVEDQARIAEKATPRCCYDAIVVLGGGIAPAIPPERDFPSLTDSSDRIWTAARGNSSGMPRR